MASADNNIVIRIDTKTKNAARQTLAAMGLDLSSGVKLFLNSIVNTQSLPFIIRTKNGYSLAEELDMRRNAEAALQNGVVYASARDMIADMDNWDENGDYVSDTNNEKI